MGISVLAVRGDSKYAEMHGVYVLDTATAEVSDLLFQTPAANVEATRDADGQVPLVSGIVFLSAAACEKVGRNSLSQPQICSRVLMD